MNTQWDKNMVFHLKTSLGLSHENAMAVVGIIAEEKMNADFDGYKRGFNDGWEKCEMKYKPLTLLNPDK
jgi:hypothetical protein